VQKFSEFLFLHNTGVEGNSKLQYYEKIRGGRELGEKRKA